MGLARDLKSWFAAVAVEAEEGKENLRQLPLLRCSEEIRERLEAEKMTSLREKRNINALVRPVSDLWTKMAPD